MAELCGRRVGRLHDCLLCLCETHRGAQKRDGEEEVKKASETNCILHCHGRDRCTQSFFLFWIYRIDLFSSIFVQIDAGTQTTTSGVSLISPSTSPVRDLESPGASSAKDSRSHSDSSVSKAKTYPLLSPSILGAFLSLIVLLRSLELSKKSLEKSTETSASNSSDSQNGASDEEDVDSEVSGETVIPVDLKGSIGVQRDASVDAALNPGTSPSVGSCTCTPPHFHSPSNRWRK